MAQQARGSQGRREMITQPVVDIEIKVEALAGDPVELTGLEMLDLDQAAQSPQAIDARRLGPLARCRK